MHLRNYTEAFLSLSVFAKVGLFIFKIASLFLNHCKRKYLDVSAGFLGDYLYIYVIKCCSVCYVKVKQ